MPYPYQPYPYQQPLDQLGQLKANQFQQLPIPQQQYQPQPTTYGINGRVVASVDAINPNEVPMDGSMAVFPRNDREEIYGKSYNSDGTIKTVIYRPVESIGKAKEASVASFELSEKDTQVFMERFDDVIERIEKLDKSVKSSGSRSQSRSKKGDESE